MAENVGREISLVGEVKARTAKPVRRDAICLYIGCGREMQSFGKWGNLETN